MSGQTPPSTAAGPGRSALLACLAACCLAVALAAFASLRARERRLAAGEARLSDIAAWTGVTDRRFLLGMAGVRERADGTVGFDPRFLDDLPAHPLQRALDSYLGNGLCVAVSVAALGTAVNGGATTGAPALLASAVAGYLLLGRIWSAAVWLELRAAG